MRYYIPKKLTKVNENRGVNGYNPYVPDYMREQYRDRAIVECVGFMVGSKFIPGKPKGHDYYMTKVHVITKSGLVVKVGYPHNEYVHMEEGTIFVGCDCNIHSYGISLMVERAKEWREISRPA